MRTNEKTVGEGGEGQPEKTTCILPAFNFPLAHRFLVQLRVRFRAADLSLNEPQKEKNTPKNKPPATQATRKGKSIYGKRQLSATDHYFPSFTCYLFFFVRFNPTNYFAQEPRFAPVPFSTIWSFVIGLSFLDATNLILDAPPTTREFFTSSLGCKRSYDWDYDTDALQQAVTSKNTNKKSKSARFYWTIYMWADGYTLNLIAM